MSTPGTFKPGIPTRRSLLSRLKDSEDQASWKEFFEIYWKLIYNTAIRAGLTDDEAQDVVQETIFTVLKKMPGFQYDPRLGSFKGWLLRITSWRIADERRKRLPGAASVSLHTLESVPDTSTSSLEVVWNEEWERNIVAGALERVKRRVSSKQYQMFDLYFVQKLSVGQIAGVMNVRRAWVYLNKCRLSGLLKKEVQKFKVEAEGRGGA